MINVMAVAVMLLETQLCVSSNFQKDKSVTGTGLSCNSLAANKNLTAYLSTVPELGLQLGTVSILTGERDIEVTSNKKPPLLAPSSMRVTSNQMNDAANAALLELQVKLGVLADSLLGVPQLLNEIYEAVQSDIDQSLIKKATHLQFNSIERVQNRSKTFAEKLSPKFLPMTQLMRALDEIISSEKKAPMPEKQVEVLREIEVEKENLSLKILNAGREIFHLNARIASSMEEIANSTTLGEFDQKVEVADSLEQERSKVRTLLILYQREYLNISVYGNLLNLSHNATMPGKLQPFVEPILAVVNLWSKIESLTVQFGSSVSDYINLAKGCLQRKIQDLTKNFTPKNKEAVRQYFKKACNDFSRQMCFDYVFATGYLESINAFNQLHISALGIKAEVKAEREKLFDTLKNGVATSATNVLKNFVTRQADCVKNFFAN